MTSGMIWTSYDWLNNQVKAVLAVNIAEKDTLFAVHC